MLSRLGQNLNGYVIRDQILLDQGAKEFVLGLRCCREADLDLFETNLNEEFTSAWFPSRKSTLHHTGAFSMLSFFAQSMHGTGGI